ncbi:hypothetical protein TIFTF001_005944 [Ficus carica]|uniref:Uncharacterized protein n=1 Tax=Ficus carica TaxID=3494 RepID=A0AA87ZZF2_FICCA|nr:hypothetical protein TIFTF001_005944 [Ficus carica]
MDNTSGDKPNYMTKEIKMRLLRSQSHLAIKIIIVEFKSIFSRAGSLVASQKVTLDSDPKREI